MIHHKYVKNKNENTVSIQHQCNVKHTSDDSKRKYKLGNYHLINAKF